MTVHTCGIFDQPKRVALCLCCATPTYEILETFVEGPRAGEARRVGPMLPHGTQIEIMLSDRSVAHLDLCLDCAAHVQPEHLLTMWDRVVDRTDDLARIAGRRDSQRRALVRQVARVYPMGAARWRRQDRDLIGVVPDGLTIDRRRPKRDRDEKGHGH